MLGEMEDDYIISDCPGKSRYNDTRGVVSEIYDFLTNWSWDKTSFCRHLPIDFLVLIQISVEFVPKGEITEIDELSASV